VTDFRFGRFELDSHTRELGKDGVPGCRISRCGAGAMLQHPRTPDPDELRDRLWPDGTFVDFEHGLNAAVKRLRSFLATTPSGRASWKPSIAAVIASSRAWSA
jgi:hypothetical protein